MAEGGDGDKYTDISAGLLLLNSSRQYGFMKVKEAEV